MKFKRLKFKNNTLSFKRFNQIIFEDNSITKTKFGGLRRPYNWHSKKVKPEFKPHPSAPAYHQTNNCYYKGKLINGKYEGFGTEMILEEGNYMEDVISFYKGNWKNGKKNGKGYWSNHHPLIGITSDAGAMDPYYVIIDDGDHYYYDGYWKDDKKHRKGILHNEEGIFEGEFNNDLKWNGILKVGVDEIIYKNGKRDLSRILPDKERFLARLENDEYIDLVKEKDEIKNDRDLILKYISVKGFPRYGIPKKIKNDKSIVLAAVKNHTSHFLQIDKKYRKDKDVLKIILSKKGQEMMSIDVFKILDEKYKKNKKFVITMIKSKPTMREELFFCLDKKLMNDKNIIKACVKHTYMFPVAKLFSKLNKKNKSNKKIVVSILKNENPKFSFAESKIYPKINPKLKDDHDVVTAALYRKWETLKKMSNKIKNNKKLLLKIMKKECGLYQYLNDKFKKQREFLIAAKNYSPKYDKKLKKVVLD